MLLDDGRTVSTDGVVIATGASARRLPGDDLSGVHTLRTLDDARALRDELSRGARRVVVIGGGFIGAETASSCAALGHDVTVVEAAPLPLVPQLGQRWPPCVPRCTAEAVPASSPARGSPGCAAGRAPGGEERPPGGGRRRSAS